MLLTPFQIIIIVEHFGSLKLMKSKTYWSSIYTSFGRLCITATEKAQFLLGVHSMFSSDEGKAFRKLPTLGDCVH